jgi:Protein of unknown function (DUF2490)
MKKNIIILFLFLFFKSNGQTVFKDAMSWMSTSVDQKIGNRFDIKLITRVRVGENFSQINSWYSDVGFNYALSNKFNLAVDYVYAPSRLVDRTFNNFHQYYSAISFKQKIFKHTYFGNRLIVQRSSNTTLFEIGDVSKNSTDLREKLGFDYKINKRYSYFIDDEILLPLSSVPFEINRNRFYTGLNYVLSKQMNIDIYFVLQSSFHNSHQNAVYYIYGFDLNFKLKKIKSKKNHNQDLPQDRNLN